MLLATLNIAGRTAGDAHLSLDASFGILGARTVGGPLMDGDIPLEAKNPGDMIADIYGYRDPEPCYYVETGPVTDTPVKLHNSIAESDLVRRETEQQLA